MEEAEDHEGEGRPPGPPRREEGRAQGAGGGGGQGAHGPVAPQGQGEDDLVGREAQQKAGEDSPVQAEGPAHRVQQAHQPGEEGGAFLGQAPQQVEIGRASCRERVCQYV